MLEDFEKMTNFYKSLCSFFSKNLYIHFNPSQNLSPILLLNGLVMITNEGSIAYKCFKKGNVGGTYSNIGYFVHIGNIACNKKSLKCNLFCISKFKLDQVHGKMLNDTNLKFI